MISRDEAVILAHPVAIRCLKVGALKDAIADLVLEVQRKTAATIADDVESGADVVSPDAALALRTSAALIRDRYGVTPDYYPADSEVTP